MLSRVWYFFRVASICERIVVIFEVNKMLFLEKVVGNEEWIECIRGDPVFCVRSSKHFEVTWKKKKKWTGKNLLTRNRYSISTKKVYYYQNWLYETGKNYLKQARNVKSFLFKAVMLPPLVTDNFSKRKWKTSKFKFGIRIFRHYINIEMQYLWYISGMYSREG